MKYLIGIVIAAIVIIGGLYYYSSSQPQTATAPQDNTGAVVQTAPVASGTETAAPSAGATVAYTASGFSPKTMTVKKGEGVTFVDQTGKGMWVASARHPDHTVYSGTARSAHCPDTTGTAFDQCSIGSSYTFTFQKTGTWAYHNHVNASDFGTIVVQ